MNTFGGHKLETQLVFEIAHSPERLLSVAVIRQAVADVATHVAKHGRAVETWAEHKAASEARTFLLRDLWEPGCLWGDQIRDLLTPGMRATLVAYCEGVKPRTPGQRHQPAPVEVAELA